MVEPLFHFEGSASVVAGQVVTLYGPEGKHAASVRRMRVGESIQLSDGRGFRARGRVSEVQQAILQVQVETVVNEGVPKPSITLVQALAKGDRDEQAVQASTEAGIAAVLPWQAEHSVSRWDATKAPKQVARWNTITTEAAKQSLRSWFPEVSNPVTSAQLVKTFGGFDLVLVLEPTAARGISQVLADRFSAKPTQKVALVIGPEGGISPRELADFEAAGAVLVRLGAEVLRTSTAGVAAVALIQSFAGNW